VDNNNDDRHTTLVVAAVVVAILLLIVDEIINCLSHYLALLFGGRCDEDLSTIARISHGCAEEGGEREEVSSVIMTQ